MRPRSGHTAGVCERVVGLLAFLPVPLVLWLFTAAPVGAVSSLLLGVVIMATHRLYARPFVRRHAPTRCLWCGGPASCPVPVTVDDPLGPVNWTACTPAHADRALRTVTTAERWRRFLVTGILGGLAIFLAFSGAAAAGWHGGPSHADAAAIFKFAVAITVVPFGLVASRGAPGSATPRSPFPLHIQALIGTAAVLWLFRLVGLLWLVQVVRYAVVRGA